MFTQHNNSSFKVHQHNLQLATFLSFVAGMVNVGSILSIQRFTTNVTGHFAVFIEELLRPNYSIALTFSLFVLFFFLGSFTSNIMVEIIKQINFTYQYTIPVIIETVLVFIAGSAYTFYTPSNPDYIGFILLYAMGLQNALVTKVSKSVVRTSHLTGLFTDLGIEVSSLFFIKNKYRRTKIKLSIQLRLRIIICFFLGGLACGLIYKQIQLKAFWIASTILVITILFDIAKKRIFKFKQWVTEQAKHIDF
ncbi:MAG: DUF1275 domain-containing protein [Chitinophagales bacterium]|nr:DUF1275 domain-containing protein [Chitinophagales bacterium]MCZ2393564.1 DUF1275 domain-containing protein [Chitinophagales bacterium]